MSKVKMPALPEPAHVEYELMLGPIYSHKQAKSIQLSAAETMKDMCIRVAMQEKAMGNVVEAIRALEVEHE